MVGAILRARLQPQPHCASGGILIILLILLVHFTPTHWVSCYVVKTAGLTGFPGHLQPVSLTSAARHKPAVSFSFLASAS